MALSKEHILAALRMCMDPEIPLNIVDLGLVYEVELSPALDRADKWDVSVKMTLTSPGCPMSQAISNDVHRRLLELPQVRQAKIDIVWEPSWTPDRISGEGRRQLQLT